MNRLLLSTTRSDGPRDASERSLFDGVAGDVRVIGRAAGVFGVLEYLNARVQYRYTGIGTVGSGKPESRVFDCENPGYPSAAGVRLEQLLGTGTDGMHSTMWAPVTTTRGAVLGTLCHFDSNPRISSLRETRVLQFVGEQLTTLVSHGLPTADGAFATVAPADAPSSRDMARALLALETSGVDDAAGAAMAMERMCSRLSDTLRQWIGDDGRDALFARAIRSSAGAQPILCELWSRGEHPFGGIGPGVTQHGLAAVVGALEAALTTLIDVIASLVGDDMVPQLLDLGAHSQPRRGEREPA